VCDEGATLAKIENFQYTIQEAFKQNFYAVPDYQREYVWREREVGQLLQDIDEQVDVTLDTPYFIGMVLVSSTSAGSFDVIDGQQRLTTLFLVLCAIKRRFGQHESPSHELMKGLLSSVDFGSDGEAVSRLRRGGHHTSRVGRPFAGGVTRSAAGFRRRTHRFGRAPGQRLRGDH
jgi:hypothetical protein